MSCNILLKAPRGQLPKASYDPCSYVDKLQSLSRRAPSDSLPGCNCQPYSSDPSCFTQMCKLESLEMGNCWVKGDVEIYEFITKPDIDRYVPHQFKHFLPGGDLHYTDIIVILLPALLSHRRLCSRTTHQVLNKVVSFS